MFFKKRRGAMLLSLALLGVTLSSCSMFDSFFGEEDTSYSIKDVTTSIDEDGNTILTITFTSSRDPITITLPSGKTPRIDETTGTRWIGEIDTGVKAGVDQPSIGEDGYRYIGETNTGIKATGVGIDSIVPATQDGKSGIIVYLTNGESTFVEIPTVSIKSITSREEGEDTYIDIIYIDDDGDEQTAEFGPFSKGEKGDAGVSISSIDYVTEKDHSITLTITMSDGSSTIVTIPPSNGIDYMEASEENGKYVITVYYTDGSWDTLEFDAPATRLSGNGLPSDSVGNNGDFFYDRTNNIIYQKVNNKWVVLVHLIDQSSGECYVTFDPQGGSLPPSALAKYPISIGTYFYGSGYDIPIPLAPSGTTFDGWYTAKVVDATKTRFSDLTIVKSDITLYAHYI
jgi:hypothetical protein